MRISDKNCIGTRITCYYSCNLFHLVALLIKSTTSIKYLELTSVLYWFIPMNLVLTGHTKKGWTVYENTYISYRIRKTHYLKRNSSHASTKRIGFAPFSNLVAGMPEWLDHLSLDQRVPGSEPPSDLTHKV